MSIEQTGKVLKLSSQFSCYLLSHLWSTQGNQAGCLLKTPI